MDTFEKKYYEALNDMRAIYPNLKGDAKLAVEHAFPELRESEDERIRKEMISFLRSPFIKENLTDEKVAPWLDWLEKQKEQEHICDSAQYEEGFKTGLEIGLRKQKEQKPIDYPYLPGWRKNRDNNKPELKRSVLMLTTHGVAEGEWLGEKWCQYRWSCELKDGEVLYWIHLSDLERLEKEGEEKQKEQDDRLADIIYQQGIEKGKDDMKEQMMKEAVDAQVVGEQRDLRLIDSTQRCLFNANRGDWLKIIIVKD